MITAMNSFFFDEDRSFNFVVLIIGIDQRIVMSGEFGKEFGNEGDISLSEDYQY